VAQRPKSYILMAIRIQYSWLVSLSVEDFSSLTRKHNASATLVVGGDIEINNQLFL